MTKRFVVLDGDLDRATRVRLAIIHGTAIDRNARIITTDDVKSKWEFLSGTGLSPRTILDLANGDGTSISDDVFKSIMRSLNSYL